MASFEDLLKKPSSDIKPPQPLPVGTYHCIVEGPPTAEESSQKKTPCRTYAWKIMSPMGDVDQQALAQVEGGVVGKTLKGQALGTSFYITEDALWRYKEYLTEHLGIDDGGGTKGLAEMEAEAPGRQLLVKLRHEISPDGRRIFNKIDSTAHV